MTVRATWCSGSSAGFEATAGVRAVFQREASIVY
jgi:hypothetical protein